MKCLYCEHNTNYRTRQKNGGSCGKCGHRFAFEPQTDKPSVTDHLFQHAIDDVSGNGKLFFTERQLWYAVDRRLTRSANSFYRWWGVLIVAAFLAFWAGGFTQSAHIGVLIFLVVILLAHGPALPPFRFVQGVLIFLAVIFLAYGQLALYRMGLRLRQPSLDLSTFLSFLSRWRQTHGTIGKLIEWPYDRWRQRDASTASSSELSTPEPDLTAYSFDRAVVTDRAETAAMLVANNFHFENNCAVLSADGYPPGIRDTVLTMLRRNPQLQVFAVHDASPRGCELPLALRGKSWFPDPSVTVVDLGLRPRHARTLRLPTIVGLPTVLPDALRGLLTPKEIAWIEAGNSAEVASLTPLRLMRSIFQGFARAKSARQEGTTTAGDGGGIWLYDEKADVYATESFG